MAHDVFISHSSKDKAHADALCAALEAARLRCWVAPRDVLPGQAFSGQILRAIETTKVMVLVFSGNANGSEEVLREVQLAARSHVHIFNFRLADVPVNDDLDYYLSVPHWLDAVKPPMSEHHARLVSAIRAILPPEEPAAGATPGVAAPAVAMPPPSPPLPLPPSAGGRRLLWPAVTAAAVLLVAGTAAALAWWATRRVATPEPAVVRTAPPGAVAPAPVPVPAVVPNATGTTPTGPRILRVKPGESIQTALTGARPGDTVQVAAGEYTETLALTEGVHLVGEGADRTVVRFDGAQNNVLAVKRCRSGEIANLCFEHTGTLREKGAIAVVWISASAVEMHHCEVRNSPGTGVYLDGGDRSTVRDCRVHHCYWAGLWAAGENTAVTFTGNQADQNVGAGICFGSRAGGVAKANRCTGNADGISAWDEGTAPELEANVELRDNKFNGIAFRNGSGGRARDNRCENNVWNGLLVTGPKTAPILLNNQALTNTAYGILFQEGAGGRAENNLCQENTLSGIGALNPGTFPALNGNRCLRNRAYGVRVDPGAQPTGADARNNELAGNTLGPTYPVRN